MKQALPSLTITRKNLTIITVTVLCVLILAFVGWSWYSRNHYTQSLTSHHQQLQARLDRAQTDISLYQDNDDYNLGQYLDTLHQDLQHLADSLPQSPHILSLSLMSADQQHQLSQLQATYRQTLQQLENSSQIASYQYQISPIIKKLNAGPGGNADQQQQLATTWKQAHQDLANIIVPQVSQTFSQKLLTTITDIADDLSAMADLYKDLNQSAFLERKAQLTDSFAAFKQLAADHQTIIKHQDQQLKDSLAQLVRSYD